MGNFESIGDFSPLVRGDGSVIFLQNWKPDNWTIQTPNNQIKYPDTQLAEYWGAKKGLMIWILFDNFQSSK